MFNFWKHHLSGEHLVWGYDIYIQFYGLNIPMESDMSKKKKNAHSLDIYVLFWMFYAFTGFDNLTIWWVPGKVGLMILRKCGGILKCNWNKSSLHRISNCLKDRDVSHEIWLQTWYSTVCCWLFCCWVVDWCQTAV